MFIFLSLPLLLDSQMLLEVVEKERIVRGNRFRQPVYRHPALPGSEFEQVFLYNLAPGF